MATLASIMSSLNIEKDFEFFPVLDKNKAVTDWARYTNPITGDFVVIHKDTFAAIKADKSITTLFLKRKDDIMFEGSNILHRTFILCIGKRESLGSLA